MQVNERIEVAMRAVRTMQASVDSEASGDREASTFGSAPHRGRSASASRLRGFASRALAGTVCSGALLLAPLLLSAPASAQAETPTTVGPAEVSAALFVAGDVTRLSKVPSGSEDVVLEKALQQLYADEPALAPAVAEEYVNDMKASLAATTAPSPASLQLMAGNQRIVAILAALERPYGSPGSELPAAAKLAVTHLAGEALTGSANIFASSEAPKYFEPLADARTNLTFTTFAPATVLRATRALAAHNHAFGEARDALWQTASEESVFSGWQELLAESKQVLDAEGLKVLRETIEAGKGTITAEPKQLTALFTQGQKKTQEQSCEHAGMGEEAIGTASISGVPQLKCSGGALYEDSRVPRTCPGKAQCETELSDLQTNAAKQARIIAEQRAAMTAAAELLRPSDNTAATLQQATAQAQAQITEEETAYANYEAEKAQKEAIADGVKEGLEAGTAVLALATENYSEGVGGLINVGFELYEHTEEGLSKPPPGPQEITLQDLADLSTQLSGFQQYTQEAFHALNTQLAGLSAQMARENYELKEELGDLGERLVKEQGTIFALQDQVKELFATQTKADLQTSIEDSVGWLKRTGEPLSGTKVQETLVALKKYATEVANGALVNNAETQPYTFEGADRQLTSKTTGEPAELNEDISYLGRFPSEQGWTTSVAPASLANITFWAESSRAYAQLMLENTSHATSADIAGLKALEKEGATLEKAQGVWSEHSGEPGSKTGNAVLDEAIARFEAAVDGGGVDGGPSIQTLLKEAAATSLEQALKTVSSASPLANPTSLTLWGGAEQPFSASAVAGAQYPALKWEECSGSKGSNGKQEMPEEFISHLPAALVDGVRLGVIGAPGSGDEVILTACRTIGKSSSVASTKQSEGETGCESGLTTSGDCKLVYTSQAKQEEEAESAGETLTLQAGEGGGTLASTSVGECSQTALFWNGNVHVRSIDPEDSTFDEAFESNQEVTNEGFTGRHVGSITALSSSGRETKWNYNETPFSGTACPYVPASGKDQAGHEFANYSSASKPLASVEPTLVNDVEHKLRELQESAYAAASHALTNPASGNPLESLAGARALVQSYVKLGFPQALASDAGLDSDVEGLGAQFLDPEPGTPRPLPSQLTALIASWVHRLEKAGGSGQPTLAQALGEDPIEEVQSRSTKWADAIAEQVKPYVEGKVEGFDTGSSEGVGEQPSLVESTLNRLQLTRDVLDEAKAPTAETLAPSGVRTGEATLRGEVDSNGGAVESCAFEYGATAFYGHSVECSTTPSATEKAVVVNAKVSNWTPEGSLHERVVLKTWGGTSYGEDLKVQLAQSTQAPSGGLILASAGTPGATIGAFKAEELPTTVQLPAGVKQIVGSLKFTVNVTPGGSARVKLELPSGSSPNAIYKLVRSSGGEQYEEVPSSLYTISGNMIELTLVDGGPYDEDGEVNGVIVDPLVPVTGTPQQGASMPPPSSSSSTPPASTTTTATTIITTTTTAAPLSANPLPPATHSSPATPQQCVSHRKVTVDVADHLALPPRATLLSSEILLHGHVVARLNGRAQAAVVNFAGLHRGPYEVTLVATLSNGETLKHTLVFRTCTTTPKSPPAPTPAR